MGSFVHVSFLMFRCFYPTHSNLSFSQAVDPDLFSNVTYRIKTESAKQLFSLNLVTGELVLLQILDFEGLAAMGMSTSYSFLVEAVDQGEVMPPGQANVTIRITVRASRYILHHYFSGFYSPFLVFIKSLDL